MTFSPLTLTLYSLLILAANLILVRRVKNRRQELPRPTTWEEVREYVARREASVPARSLVGTSCGALLCLVFAFLFVLSAAVLTQGWWIDQQFRALGITTTASLIDVVVRGSRGASYYVQYEYTTSLPNQTLASFRHEASIPMEQAFEMRQTLRKSAPQPKPQLLIEYLPYHPTISRLKPQEAARPAWQQAGIVVLLVSLSNLWAAIAVGAITRMINPRASRMWIISGATIILVGSYVSVFWFALFAPYPPLL